MDFNIFIKLQQHHLMPPQIKEVINLKWHRKADSFRDLNGFFTKGEPTFFFLFGGQAGYLIDNFEAKRKVFHVHIDPMGKLDWTHIIWLNSSKDEFCYDGPRDDWDIDRVTPEDFGWCSRCLADYDMCNCDQEDPHVY